MADIWLSGFTRVLLGSGVRGKPYQYTHNPKGCLHTTEGTGIAGARAAYAPYPPHLIYDWRTRKGEQHVPLNLASYSAMDGNDDDYMIQVELVGFARETRSWPEEALRNIAQDVVAPLEQAFGIPRQAIWEGFKDERDGMVLASASSPIRITAAELRDFSGWLGHQHLPAPDSHWDPGALPLARIFSFLSQEDDMANFSDADKAALLAAAEKITANYSPTADDRPLPIDTADDITGHVLSVRGLQEKMRNAQAGDRTSIANIETVVNQILDLVADIQVGAVTPEQVDAGIARATQSGGSLSDVVRKGERVALVDGDSPNGT